MIRIAMQRLEETMRPLLGFKLLRRPRQTAKATTLLVLAILCGYGFGVSPAGPAHADDVVIGTAPEAVEMTLSPGSVVTQEITVFNAGPHHVRVSASVEGEAEMVDGLSAAGWLTVDSDNFLVAGLEERTITVTVEVPDEKLPSGGRYAAVSFDAVSVDPLQDIGATTARAEVPFLINVDGEGPLLREADIDWFVPVLEPNGLVGFRARLVNSGNVHFAANGTVEISGPDGLLADRPEFAESPAVLPTKGRVLVAGPAVPLTPGDSYSAKATLAFGGADPIVAIVAFAVSPALKVEDLRPVEGPGQDLKFVVTLENQGQVALRPRATVYVRGANGTEMGTTLHIGDTGDTGLTLLLPGHSGEMTFNFSQQLPPGEHTIIVRVYYGAPNPIAWEQPFKTGGAEPQSVREPPEEAGTGGGTAWYLPVGAAAGVLFLAVAVGLTPPFGPLRRKLRNAVRGLGKAG